MALQENAWRSRFQYFPYRISGNRYRSFLCRADRRLTNPQIGNYGTNQADNESARPYIEGLIVREFSPISSNWRSERVTDEYMERYSVPVLAEIDTHALCATCAPTA